MGPAGGCTGGLPARCAPTSPSLQHISLLPAPPGSRYFRSGLRWFSGVLPCRKAPGVPLQHLSVWTAVWVPLRLALLEVVLIMSVGESTGIRAQALAVSSPAGFLHEPGHIAVLP